MRSLVCCWLALGGKRLVRSGVCCWLALGGKRLVRSWRRGVFFFNILQIPNPKPCGRTLPNPLTRRQSRTLLSPESANTKSQTLRTYFAESAYSPAIPNPAKPRIRKYQIPNPADVLCRIRLLAGNPEPC